MTQLVRVDRDRRSAAREMLVSGSKMEDITTRDVGELCTCGDRACEVGDYEMLAYVADRLSTCAGEPFHCKLAALAEICRCDQQKAVEAWTRVKERARRALPCSPGVVSAAP